MTSLKNKVTTTDGTEITPDHFGYKGHSSEGNHKKFGDNTMDNKDKSTQAHIAGLWLTGMDGAYCGG